MSDELIGTARGIVEAFNANDWDGFRNLMTKDAVYDEVGTSRTIEGVDPIIEAMKAWKEAMPDVKGTVDNAAPTDNGVVLEVTWRGTHTGPLAGPEGSIPATGKSQTTRASWVMEFDGPKHKRSRHYFDMLSFMKQLGVIE